MSDIKISLIGSAFRTENWLKVYNRISKNKLNFELIFVGPNEPNFKLPYNFKFIKSDVKPVQCYEIAARASQGELIQFMTDDFMFEAENSLDILYKTYKDSNNYKNIFSMALSQDGKQHPLDNSRFDPMDSNSPIVGVSNAMSKIFYDELGGLDKNFIASMHDVDLALRAYCSGGNVFMTDIKVNEDKIEMSRGSNTCSEFWNFDRKHIIEIWDRKKNKYYRKTKFTGYSDLDLVKYSQGPRGRWRGNKPIIIEKFIDGPYKFCKIQIRRLLSFSKYIYYIKMILK